MEVDHVFDFVSNSAEGVFAVDRCQLIVMWNEGAAATFGYSAEEVLGKRCCEIVGGRDAESHPICYLGCAVITDALRHGLPPTRDIVTCTKQGHEIWLSVTSIVVPSVCEAFTVLIHLFRDVTRYHELMQAATGLANLASGLSSPDVRRLSIVPRPEDSGKLTVREREVLALLATGLSTKEIARRLFISPRTAGNHINNILGKLGVHSRLDAVVYAVRNGLV